ncbi:short-chain dehydrogenase [Armillaria borealis]|uniref:Short-chain dehydrogenase n=1 Tax=Armillaria borealis TaxID=47425 RepID=A0AA39JBI1_9AGAR|nr:short-chain dehydrogenase [Armillaria borealis]
MADLNMATVMSLSGRVGLVTGGGTGIGFMIAKAFAANGAKVSQDPSSHKQMFSPHDMDVTDEESVKAGAKHIEGVDGKLDILVNNAGIGGSLRDPDFTAKKLAATDPFEPETVQTWTDIFALNTIASFFIVRAFQSLLIKGAQSRHEGTASVINVAYPVMKVALDKFTVVLGTSFAQRGIPIRVNVLAPGVFASQLVSPELLEEIKTKPFPGMVAPIPAKRQGIEAEMGMTAVYLAVSDYTNGAVLSVDGAISLVNP